MKLRLKRFLRSHKRQLKIIGTCACFYFFVLICLPALIATLFGGEESEKFPLPFSFYPNKLEVPDSIVIYRTAKAITEEIPFEEYIKGVVASEMPSSFEEEALKAQSVAARTYSLSKILRSGNSGFPPAHPEAALCDTVHCQVYRFCDELADIKGQDWIDSGLKKICSAVEDTAGQLMYYDGDLVEQALFHSSCGGKTENSEDVFASAFPYLKSVDSPYEEDATHRNETYTFTYDQLAGKLNSYYPDKYTSNVNSSSVFVISCSEGGNVTQIQVGTSIYSGRELREALSLYSADFSVTCGASNITITSNGYGHGVGMSQYGANGMAKAGYNYKDILTHYYTGVLVY